MTNLRKIKAANIAIAALKYKRNLLNRLIRQAENALVDLLKDKKRNSN